MAQATNWKNDQRTQEAMLCALLTKPWKDTDFVAEDSHPYLAPISVMETLAVKKCVAHRKGIWELTESGRTLAKKLNKRFVLESLVEEPGGRISGKEVGDPNTIEALKSLQKDGLVELRGATWRTITHRKSNARQSGKR